MACVRRINMPSRRILWIGLSMAVLGALLLSLAVALHFRNNGGAEEGTAVQVRASWGFGVARLVVQGGGEQGGGEEKEEGGGEGGEEGEKELHGGVTRSVEENGEVVETDTNVRTITVERPGKEPFTFTVHDVTRRFDDPPPPYNSTLLYQGDGYWLWEDETAAPVDVQIVARQALLAYDHALLARRRARKAAGNAVPSWVEVVGFEGTSGVEWVEEVVEMAAAFGVDVAHQQEDVDQEKGKLMILVVGDVYSDVFEHYAAQARAQQVGVSSCGDDNSLSQWLAWAARYGKDAAAKWAHMVEACFARNHVRIAVVRRDEIGQGDSVAAAKIVRAMVKTAQAMGDKKKAESSGKTKKRRRGPKWRARVEREVRRVVEMMETHPVWGRERGMARIRPSLPLLTRKIQIDMWEEAGGAMASAGYGPVAHRDTRVRCNSDKFIDNTPTFATIGVVMATTQDSLWLTEWQARFPDLARVSIILTKKGGIPGSFLPDLPGLNIVENWAGFHGSLALFARCKIRVVLYALSEHQVVSAPGDGVSDLNAEIVGYQNLDIAQTHLALDRGPIVFSPPVSRGRAAPLVENLNTDYSRIIHIGADGGDAALRLRFHHASVALTNNENITSSWVKSQRETSRPFAVNDFSDAKHVKYIHPSCRVNHTRTVVYSTAGLSVCVDPVALHHPDP